MSPEILRRKSESEPIKSRLVTPNQEFTLFELEYTSYKKEENSRNKYGTFKTLLALDLGFEIPLPLQVQTLYTWGYQSRYESLTPFDPELGYQITEADYNPNTRVTKLKTLIIESGDPILNSPLAPVHLDIDSMGFQPIMLAYRSKPYQILKKVGLISKSKDPLCSYDFVFSDDVIEKIKNIRLQLTFPQYPVLEAKPDRSFLHYARLEFTYFYPADKGPLPVVEKPKVSRQKSRERGMIRFSAGHYTRKGFEVVIRSNIEDLQKIKAKFVLVD